MTDDRPRRRRVFTMLVAVALPIFGVACTSTGGGGGTASTSDPSLKYTTDDFKPTTYCPPVVIRPGTEAMSIYDKGHDGDQASVRYLASITKTARQCSMSADTLNVKLGLGGRVLAGPKGGPGSITLPIRVAIVKQVGGTGPLYSQLFKVPVSLAAPDYGADFNQVFDQLNVKVGPDDRNLIVYVGFDEGTKPPAPLPQPSASVFD